MDRTQESGAYWVVDLLSFESKLSAYDAVSATQTIASGFVGGMVLEDAPLGVVTGPDIAQDREEEDLPSPAEILMALSGEAYVVASHADHRSDTAHERRDRSALTRAMTQGQKRSIWLR
jgi:hypothetical protein